MIAKQKEVTVYVDQHNENSSTSDITHYFNSKRWILKNTYHVVFGIKTKLKQEVLCLDNLYINLFGITQHNDSILVGFDFAVE